MRVSTETTKEKEARDFLKDREGRAVAGEPVLLRASKVRYGEARDDLKGRHYETTGSRGPEEAGWRFDHLDGFFAGRRLSSITGAVISEYIARRQGEKASNGTIKCELGVLGKMLRLAYDYGKLMRLPVVHKPKESAPRQRFFEPEQFEAVRRQPPDDLQLAAPIAYTFGWRMQSEVLTLEPRQVDLDAGTLRLDPGTTKNDEGRVVYMRSDLKRLLAAQIERVRALERSLGARDPAPISSPRRGARRRPGQRRDDLQGVGHGVREGGRAGMLHHDLRARPCGTWQRGFPSGSQ